MRIVCELFDVHVSRSDRQRVERRALVEVAQELFPQERIRGLWVHEGVTNECGDPAFVTKPLKSDDGGPVKDRAR